MTTTVYWQAPLWQVVVAGALVTGAIAILALRAFRRRGLAETLGTAEPRLAGEAVFYFEPSAGPRGITPAASALAADPELRHRLTELVAAAHDAGTLQRATDWPRPGASLVAVPVGADHHQSRAVVAVVSTDTLGPLVGGEVADEPDWIAVGPAIRVHKARPVVRVRRPDAAGRPAWEESALTPTEDALLRTLLAHPGSIVAAEDLFRAAWPDDPVGRHGLRPEQRDRLRRLVFQLRQRVEPEPGDPKFVATAHGVGYALYGSEGL